ncbi:MAG: Mut7-C RNAse domain-containing protein [Phormidesmis sp.]
MPQAVFRFYGSLNDFLMPTRRQIAFSRFVEKHASIKDAIEALGVPHPEIDLILVNGESVSFAHQLQVRDRVSVYPRFDAIDIDAVSQVRPQPLKSCRFVLDVHLGKLARYLRLLGFDALYRNDYDDKELAQISSKQQRILLTQDLGLLKRSLVTYGYRVRSADPQQQVAEVLSRFDLYQEIAPFRRCSRCNGLLASVEKQAVRDRLPYFTALHYHEFFQCQSCEQVYWKGAHYERMQRLVERLSEQREHTSLETTPLSKAQEQPCACE